MAPHADSGTLNITEYGDFETVSHPLVMKQGIGAPERRFASRNAESANPTRARAIVDQSTMLRMRDCIFNECF